MERPPLIAAYIHLRRVQAVADIDSPIELSTAARSVAIALSGVANATVASLSELAGVSKSTVSKTLVALEQAGAATRSVRETGGFREPDLWSPMPELGSLLSAEVAGGDAETIGVSGVPGAGDGESVRESDEAPDAQSDVEQRCAEETNEPPSPAAQTDEPETSGPPPRLARGGLGDLVAEVLAGHPEVDYTPTMISHMLSGRSAGAIANALERQVKSGTVVRVCEAPKRYRHVGSEPADAR